MIWQPLKDDVGGVEARLSETVRALVAAYPAGGPEQPAWQALALADGRPLQLRLAVMPRSRLSHGRRAALDYAVSGQAVFGGEGFRCEGVAVLDLKTRALLDVTCRLVSLGPVATP
ncbi:hypothetical protein [Azorhizobium doebereinerae]|uniref:hypothetical protein n=1 Tax=Azorhizobium doebereinerae TaxID=281091 RepID=UPI00041FE169|nr:hypothetical protein [Azorhizobium doebereinerae]